MFDICEGKVMLKVVVAMLLLGLATLPTITAQAQTFSDPAFTSEVVTTLPVFSPVGLTWAPDGRMFIWQKDGVVRIFKNGTLLPTPFIDINFKVNNVNDRGLLGLALDPNFSFNGYVYLLYTYEEGGNPNAAGAKTARLTRVTADPNNPDIVLANSEIILLGSIGIPSCNNYASGSDCIPSDADSHTIGTVRFAPDGKMFVSIGDGASYTSVVSDALRAQNLDSYAGKILRINPDGTAPSDNPFSDGTNSIRSKVWAYGLRNPYRFGLHPTTGEPYIGDVGWNSWEEINRGRGANFGWPCYEGNGPQPGYQSQFTQCQQLLASAVTPPLYTYDRSEGSTAIGGAFYTAAVYPQQYGGSFFFADYSASSIRRLVFDANGNLLSVEPFATNAEGPVSVELGPDGLLYYVSILTGQVRRIRYNGPSAVASATPTSGYSPLAVSFSSAGSSNPGGGQLTYLWEFGDGATSTQANPSHSYIATGVVTFIAKLTVTNPQNASSSATVTITVGSLPPTATILTPANGTIVIPGQTVTYEGSATDPDQGALPSSALSWLILLHHNSHQHAFQGVNGSQGSFVVENHGAIAFTATLGARNVTVSNPDTQSATLTNGFSVIQAPTPTLSGVNPASGSQGQNLNVTLTGTNFQSGASCGFGVGITVNSCAFDSPTQLTANLTIAFTATLGARNVTVSNPDTQSVTLTNGFSVTQGGGGQTTNLTVAVLVNSANSTGYNTNPASPGEFQRYPQLYLDHLQAPYEIMDTATTNPPADLSARHLILAGHTGLNLSAAWRNAVAAAVNGGTGFVNLDDATDIGTQSHIQSIFGATSSVQGAAASSIAVPAAVIPGGPTPHYIAGLQKKFLGDPAGDIVYSFHGAAGDTAAPTTLLNANGTVVARLGSDPLIVATSSGAGRAVHFGSYIYLKADRFGFVQGADDLFWRSLVWAARKPFALRGYPRLWTVQMDDTTTGWPGRVRDLYDPALTGAVAADGTGGPWKPTGYVYTDNLPPVSADRASAISDILAGKLEVTPHSFDGTFYGDMYWNGSAGEFTDAQWLSKLAAINNWKAGNGGSDAIPSFSRSLVAHWWDLSNNTGHDLWNDLGFRYVTSIQKPGFQQPNTNVNQYNGAERIPAGPFWKYEKPPKTTSNEDFPFFFADDYVVGSRAGFSARTFYLFATQYPDRRFARSWDFAWPSAANSQSTAQSLDQLQRYTWRHWSGLNPVQLFTHDASNYEVSSVTDRRSLISQASTWLRSNRVEHAFMDDLGDYIYARTKSRLATATYNGSLITFTFTGTATTPDGALFPTRLLVFSGDTEGQWKTVPGFTSGFVVSIAP